MKPPARKRKEPPKYSENNLGLSNVSPLPPFISPSRTTKTATPRTTATPTMTVTPTKTPTTSRNRHISREAAPRHLSTLSSPRRRPLLPMKPLANMLDLSVDSASTATMDSPTKAVTFTEVHRSALSGQQGNTRRGNKVSSSQLPVALGAKKPRGGVSSKASVLCAVRVRPPGHLLAPRLLPGGQATTRPLYPGGRGTMRPGYPGGRGTMRPGYPGGRGTMRPGYPGGRGTKRPGYPGGRGFTRPSNQELPRFRQAPPGPRIPLLRPQALVFSPPPSSPTTSFQEDSTSDPAPLLPHLNPSLPPVYNVSPCTALLPDREEIFLSSDDEGGEVVPVSLPVLPATITISRVSVVQELFGARRLLSEAISRVQQWGQGEETDREEIVKVAKRVKMMIEDVEQKLN